MKKENLGKRLVAAEALAERTGVTLIDRELLGTSRMYV
jgi:hypothetical protein